MFDSTAEHGRKRLLSGIVAAALEAGLVLLLIHGLTAPTSALRGVTTALTSLDLPPPPPSPKPPARAAQHRKAASGVASRSGRAAAVVALRIVLPKPVPVAIVPIAGVAVAPDAGASSAGSGTGGNGSGSGGGGVGGDGPGGGGNDPELVGGRIKPSDTPDALREAPFSGTTRALVAIDAGGAVRSCRTLASSGSADLDALTCRLIQERFRFRPARDAAGRAVAGRIIYEHEWEVGGGFDRDPPS